MTSESRTFRFGDFSLDSGERLLQKNGAEVTLRPSAFDTLLCLLERNGHLIPTATESRSATKAPPAWSIAVLPFANMSPDPNNEFFCEGLSEELINRLTKVSVLRVVDHSSSFSFKGRNLDARKIGRQLSVAAILEGSVPKTGNRLRISAQLIDTAEDFHLWSEQYERPLEDVFAIQDEISAKVLEVDPHNTIAHFYLGYSSAHAGKYEESIEMFQKVQQLTGETLWIEESIGWVYGLAGKKSRARAILRESRSRIERKQYIPSSALALVHWDWATPMDFSGVWSEV